MTTVRFVFGSERFIIEKDFIYAQKATELDKDSSLQAFEPALPVLRNCESLTLHFVGELKRSEEHTSELQSL